jgi:hypothetical protein
MSIAKKTAERCHADKGYYAVTDRGDSFHVRIYGNGKSDAGLTGLWHLMTDAELAEVGHQFGVELSAHRFQPGGIIVTKHGGPTCYAVAVAVLRFLGIDKADVRYV